VYVMAPDLIRTVLLDEAGNFEKGDIPRRALGPALGESILIAETARWRWQRRAVAGLFRQERIAHFLPRMTAAAERTRDRWHAFPSSAEIDISREMMRTTFEIIVNTMLPRERRLELDLIERSITNYLDSTSWVIALAMLRAPRWVPYPGVYRANTSAQTSSPDARSSDRPCAAKPHWRQ
jgi:cytochrome P450